MSIIEKRTKMTWMLVLLVPAVFMALAASARASESKGPGPADVLVVSGTIANAQAKRIADASIEFRLDGSKIESQKEVVSESGGTFMAELRLPRGSLARGKVTMEVRKPSYRASGPIPLETLSREKTDADGTATFVTHQSVVLNRIIGPAFWIATLILILVYAMIAFELVHRTLAAFLGAALLLFISYTAGTFDSDYFILTFEHAVHAMDMNVIFLLMAMMMIVGVLKKTGLFQWLAYKSYQAARGNVIALSIILMFVTALTSAFLDNVTTMILIIPVTVNIAGVLKINPLTLLLPEVFASNVGGTATLIGDPPNIMIGSYANLTFVDFVLNLTLICLICLAVSVVYFIYWYRKGYMEAEVVDVPKMVAELKETYGITNKKLLVQSSVMLGITILLFIVHGALHMEPSIAAMIGAAILLVISRVDIVKVLEKEIEWPTLIFFMMLFVIVAGAEETGLIQVIADWVNHMSRGSIVVAVLVILWVSALASAIIDNIPFTATMLPIVAYLNQAVPGAQTGVLWWALALGACLGGNGTMIGASANVVTVGIAESLGHHISFMGYMKAAFVPMILTIVLASVWLLLVEI